MYGSNGSSGPGSRGYPIGGGNGNDLQAQMDALRAENARLASTIASLAGGGKNNSFTCTSALPLLIRPWNSLGDSLRFLPPTSSLRIEGTPLFMQPRVPRMRILGRCLE